MSKDVWGRKLSKSHAQSAFEQRAKEAKVPIEKLNAALKGPAPQSKAEHAERAALHMAAADALQRMGGDARAEVERRAANEHAAKAIEAPHPATSITEKPALGFSSVRGGTASGGHADPKSGGSGDDRKRDDHGRFA